MGAGSARRVVRVIDRLAADLGTVVTDGVGSLHDLGGPPRSRYATAQAIAREADVLVAVCDSSPVGISRLLTWTVDLRRIAPSTPIVVVANRAPATAFRRGELYDEISSSMDVVDVVFAPFDPKVAAAAWDGVPIAKGRFTRSLLRLAELVLAVPVAEFQLSLDVAS
jgi:MinD-like ATPase involved in chromosome partitioning or flagellar assembly